jgi:glutamate synthase (NADPH/NADH) small chain
MQLEILPEPPPVRSEATPWPMWPDMLRESSSHKEGGRRRWAVATAEFKGTDGRVTGLRCNEVEWRRPESGGREVPVDLPGTGFQVEADLVLLATGFVGPGRNELVEKLGIASDERGFIRRDENFMTSDPGTFVAGDMTQGASLVVRAIGDGMNCAQGVMRYFGRSRSPAG